MPEIAAFLMDTSELRKRLKKRGRIGENKLRKRLKKTSLRRNASLADT